MSLPNSIPVPFQSTFRLYVYPNTFPTLSIVILTGLNLKTLIKFFKKIGCFECLKLL